MVISALINTIQLVMMQHVHICHVSSLTKDNFIIKHYMYTSTYNLSYCCSNKTALLHGSE